MENEIRYADLFGGVGGFRLGIERAEDSKIRKIQQIESGQSSIKSEEQCGMCNNRKLSCVFYTDIDKYSVQTYNKNFGEQHEATDIRTIKEDSIPDIDMLCGGFPCQAFSIAGKRRGFEDTRGTLFFEIARIIKAKRPKIVFLENVKGLLNHNKGQTFSVIIQTLSELGYDVQWMVLNSKFFGVPQNRERVFIIGSIRGTSKPEILPFNKDVGETNIQVAGYLNEDGWDKRNECIRRIYNPEGCCSTIPTGQGGGVMPKILQIGTRLDSNSGTQPFQQDRVYDSSGVSPALQQGLPEGGHKVSIMRGRPKIPYENGKRELNYTTYEDTCPTISQNCASGDQKNIVMPQIRRLTPIECERLQGFPDGWTEGVSDTQRYKQMGNAVTVNVIEAIIGKILTSFQSQTKGDKK